MTGFQDPYCYPGTHVLRNHFDERDPARLEVIERELSYADIIELGDNPVRGRYDLAHLCAIHQRIFGRVYPWAGQVRTVELGKGSTQFMPHTLIPRAAEYLFGQIKEQNYLRGMSRDQLVTSAAEHLANLNHLHVFREGNGRAQRAYFRQLAQDAGWRIAWERMDPKANIQASILSNVDPKSPRMRDFLDPLVEPLPPQATAQTTGQAIGQVGGSTADEMLLDPQVARQTMSVLDRAKAALAASKSNKPARPSHAKSGHSLASPDPYHTSRNKQSPRK